jgi:hypothetical protein
MANDFANGQIYLGHIPGAANPFADWAANLGSRAFTGSP